MSESKGNYTVTVSNRTLVRIIFLIVLAVLVITFFRNISQPLTLIFLSFFLALALNPAVSWIASRLKSKSRVRATAVAYIAVILIVVGFFSLTVPPLVKEVREFIKDAPRIAANFKNQDSSVADLARRYEINEQIEKITSDLSSRLSDVRGPVLSTSKRIGATFVSTVAVLVMTFMMLIEGPMWLDKLWRTMPKEKRKHNKQLAHKMYGMVTGFVNGQLVLAIVASIFALFALLISSTILDVSINAVALAGIVAIFGLVPLIGNPLAAAIVIIACLFNSVALAVVMLVYFIVYSQIENATLQPYIQSRANDLTPLIVFIAALIGIGFGGIIGALVAVPVAGCVKILVEDYFSTRMPKV